MYRASITDHYQQFLLATHRNIQAVVEAEMAEQSSRLSLTVIAFGFPVLWQGSHHGEKDDIELHALKRVHRTDTQFLIVVRNAVEVDEPVPEGVPVVDGGTSQIAVSANPIPSLNAANFVHALMRGALVDLYLALGVHGYDVDTLPKAFTACTAEEAW